MGYGIINKNNNAFTAYRYKIVAVTAATRRFYVSGNHTFDFTVGTTIHIGASLYNNGSYTVLSSSYDTTLNRTRLTVEEPIPTSETDGVIDLIGRSIPWITGDVVVVSSNKFLPPPLHPNTPYYVIRLSGTRYKLALSYDDAINGVAIDYTAPGDGSMTVAQIDSTFRVMGGAGNTNELWYHYTLDKTSTRSFTPPTTFVGMQEFINLIDGYSAYQHDSGLLQGIADSNDFDPYTGRLITWQLEAERFIDWAFGLRNTRMTVTDTYAVVASPSTNLLTFSSSVPMWLSGTAVTLSSTGTMPSPLIAGASYYVILSGNAGQFRLSTSPTSSDTSAYVDILTAGTGLLNIGLFDRQRAFPRFELNPARNNAWIDTPLGVLSNVIDGPYTDIRIQQTLYDQYGRPIGPENIAVYRQDERSRISIRSEIGNDVDPIYSNDPYNYIHLGGGHFFLEGYEHFLLLNNYTVSGALVYDPFFGLQTDKFNVDYFEKTDYTLRPTLGGFYLIDQKFLRNIEGSISDSQNFYDLLALSEATTVAQRSRELIGYKGRNTFLDLLNINSKSQLMFYRGMIQQKGSINSVNAYINSRRFVDAKLDEFWAYKLGTFGDARKRIYPELNLFMTDGVDDLRFEFLGLTESSTGSEEIVTEFTESINKGFRLVTFTDELRWNDFPEQRQKIESPLFLDAEATSMTTIYVSETAPDAGRQFIVDFWHNPLTSSLVGYNYTLNTWTVDYSTRLLVEGDFVYFQLDTICDDVRVVRRDLVDGNLDNYTTTNLEKGTNPGMFKRVNAELIRLSADDFTGMLVVFTINPAASKISPTKLIDWKANTVIQTIPMWHPAIGEHAPYALSKIKLRRGSDPAHYNTTINPSADNYELNAWNQAEVGTVWWDTSHVGYMPYYDDQVFTSINDRIANWGKLAPWADNKVYEWVRSSVQPDTWNDLVIAQANDTTIPNDEKATGSAKKTVFKRSRKKYPITVTTGRLVTTAGVLNDGDVVVFNTIGNLPGGLQASTRYIVDNVTAGTTFDVLSYETGDQVQITSAGGGTIYVVPAFLPSEWIKQTILHERIAAPFMIAQSNVLSGYVSAVTYPFVVRPTLTPKLAWTPTDPDAWDVYPEDSDPDIVDIYVNGVLIEGGLVVKHVGSTLYVDMANPLPLRDRDMIDIVRPIHTITTAEAVYDPDAEDDGGTLVQWKEDFEYTTNTLTTGGKYTGSVTRTYYYFWVEGTTTRDSLVQGSLSVQQSIDQLTEIGSPYMIVQKPKDDPTLVDQYTTVDFVNQSYRTVPIMYRQVIVRNVINYINDDQRYLLRFTNDGTLRESLDRYNRDVNVKDLHEKWILFRQEQTHTIDYELWNRLTEALVGYKILADETKVRVPALDRELYDATYNASTRIGLGVDQAFTDRALGLSTVLGYLNNQTIDFAPVSIDAFFANYSFDTPENIRIAMDAVYTTFSATHINRIWFEVLNDSFSLRGKYEELLKTSWLALHGVRVLEVGGLFDD